MVAQSIEWKRVRCGSSVSRMEESEAWCGSSVNRMEESEVW